MKDSHGRELYYLRVSVTDRCNLRCGYCMPAEGVPSLPHSEILRFDEVERVVRVMAELGVTRVRLTGGEPLVRKGIAELAGSLRAIPGIGFLGLTTNAVLLAGLAAPLHAAGVDGVNISMDTTDPARYALLTRRDEWANAWRGLQAALHTPFATVRLNSVLSPESLPSDFLGVVELARKLPVDVRLIEWMPMTPGEADAALGADAALALIGQAFGTPTPCPVTGREGPARYYTLPGFQGRVGLIPAMSHNFCAGCNRLRLTATGELKLCLFYDAGLPLKPLLRGGASDGELKDAILRAVAQKPLRHRGVLQPGECAGEPGQLEHPDGMNAIGG